MSVDQEEIKKATKLVKLKSELTTERTFIIISALGSLATALLLVFYTLGKDRLDLVYLNNEKIDVPTLLSKVGEKDNSVKIDRWVRGFARRVVGYYFISPDDSSEFAQKGLAWIHAHSSRQGRNRSSSFLDDFANYDSQRKTKYTLFFPLNDPSFIKIRSSKEDSGVFFVEIPGTYNIHTEEGETLYDARLKLYIKTVGVSGFPSKYGVVNATGLELVNGSIEFVEDLTVDEITRVSLFLDVGNSGGLFDSLSGLFF